MQEKSPYRQKKILLTALRKKCLPCRENSAYRMKKNLLTGWRKYSLPHDGKFILPCIAIPQKPVDEMVSLYGQERLKIRIYGEDSPFIITQHND